MALLPRPSLSARGRAIWLAAAAVAAVAGLTVAFLRRDFAAAFVIALAAVALGAAAIWGRRDGDGDERV